MNKTSQHTEWLSLIEVAGPFLALQVLEEAFPQGLEMVATPRRQRLRQAYDEWVEAVENEDTLLSKLHQEWIRMVVMELLECDEFSLETGAAVAASYEVSSPDTTDSFGADWAIVSSSDHTPKLFISIQAPGTDIEKPQKTDRWPASLQERIIALCRVHNCRLGLITNGERWMLINAPVGGISSAASWYARLWFQEPITLKAFQSLLNVRRCFGPKDETLEVLLDKSLEHHEEITDTLGEQVRRAVEVLVQCLDRADADRNRELLKDVTPSELYEAGLTVMMRLVFILCAEERGLLLLGDPVYDASYAISTLRNQLSEDADRFGNEVLDRRHDAWARLLSVFRAVYGGIEHEALRMPPLGGSVFDPDRFPFLEGRARGTSWLNNVAVPIPIDNRTVLLLLTSLQVLEQSSGALLLSYRALDVEQIGHVYEGLLEHTVIRVPDVTLGLLGTKKAKNPNLSLAQLESASKAGQESLIVLLADTTNRSIPAIRNGIEKPVDESIMGRLLSSCSGDAELVEEITPFANLLRADAWEELIVYSKNSFMVTMGTDRRETGTHYTPKSLTEKIVATTLEPLVYIGPAEGTPRGEWRLRSSNELLDLKVCDPAMGSGAFLVQACRWLAEKLVEAWEQEKERGNFINANGDMLDVAGDADPLPESVDECLLVAKRLIAERCLYGVDINPLAVELSKLSIWLVTMAKGRPFGFLDHNLRSGDSLLGIYKLEQLTCLSMKGERRELRLFGQNIEKYIKEVMEIRMRLRAIPIRDIHDVEAMDRLDKETQTILKNVELIADAVIGEALRVEGFPQKLENALNALAVLAEKMFKGDERTLHQLARETKDNLAIDLSPIKRPRNPFHWVLEFPEVFVASGGFDAIIGNPPYLGGKKILAELGASYRKVVVQFVAENQKGSADLCVYFVLRICQLLNKGFLGLITTNSIAEGDNRVVGLDTIVSKGSLIIRAIKSMPWPGKANVAITPIWISTGSWAGNFILDDCIVAGITPYLTETSVVCGNPFQLRENRNIAFQGSLVHGQGFVLSKEEATQLIASNPSNSEVVMPYLRGEDFLNNPDQLPSRYVINFRDWSYERAQKYTECFQILIERVKKDRDELVARGGQIHEYDFWKFWDKRLESYERISKLSRVLFHSFTSKYLAVSFSPLPCIFAAPHVVIGLDGYRHFGLLQSTVHEAWVRQYSSTLETRMRYAPTDCFETFPFPPNIQRIESIAMEYFETRRKLMINSGIGLTKLYNQYHSPTDQSEKMRILRSLHTQLDAAVLSSYGWNDLKMNHDFYMTKLGVRFTIDAVSQGQILQLLLKLNHDRKQEECCCDSCERESLNPNTSRNKSVTQERGLFDEN